MHFQKDMEATAENVEIIIATVRKWLSANLQITKMHLVLGEKFEVDKCFYNSRAM